MAAINSNVEMVDPFKFKPVLAVHFVEDPAFDEFLSSSNRGVHLVPEHFGDATSSLKADAGDFAKWIKSKHPDLPILLPGPVPKIVLRGADIWLPLIYLAGDTSMQVLLNMTASYLYDKAKGALKTDLPKVHMSVMYQDKKLGRTKRFEFSGDQEALAKAIKRFDLDNFFDDSP